MTPPGRSPRGDLPGGPVIPYLFRSAVRRSVHQGAAAHHDGGHLGAGGGTGKIKETGRADFVQVSEWMLCGHIGKGVFTHLTDKDLPVGKQKELRYRKVAPAREALPSPRSPGCRIIPAAPRPGGRSPGLKLFFKKA